MIDNHLKTQLEKATLDLDKTTDVEGILIVARDGQILHHNLRVDVDINLFGPMSQVISNSSHRLLSSSGQGELERVLVESSGGKALFLGLENAHLIILMLDSANVGMVMVNAKRASQIINEVTHDLELEVPTELPEEAPEIKVEEVAEEEPLADISTNEEVVAEKVISEELPVEETPVEGIKAEDEAVAITDETVMGSEEIIEKTAEEPTAPEPQEVKTELETQELEKVTVDETVIEKAEPEIVETKPETVKKEPEETKPPIPTVKPPISFPTLPKDVQVPDEPEERSELILDIYEAIFLAMAMGAAKIMGVAPARGLTKQFLPFEKCPKLLHNVELKSNATINFDQIKKNATDIPLPEREKVFIQDFSRMIDVITENYGRVMGYEAFRGMVRAEFMEIKKSYGDAMDKLNIKGKIHPEIAQLFT